MYRLLNCNRLLAWLQGGRRTVSAELLFVFLVNITFNQIYCVVIN